MNNNKLSYYQLNKYIIKLKLQYKNKNPEFRERKKAYERQYYQKRKLINKIERISLYNNKEIPDYLLSNVSIVKIEYGPIWVEL
jgi:hypothetical protein